MKISRQVNAYTSKSNAFVSKRLNATPFFDAVTVQEERMKKAELTAARSGV